MIQGVAAGDFASVQNVVGLGLSLLCRYTNIDDMLEAKVE